MSNRIELLFTPAEFERLPERDLSEVTCVVFDVLRATSSMVAALGNGATGIVPVSSISEALEWKRGDAQVILAGERDGVRIRADLAHGTDFDLGNSPREFTRERVAGHTIVMTTTNGTRALRACAGAHQVLIGSFLNLQATAEHLLKAVPPSLLLVCGGTYEEAAYEDVLGGGALADLVWAAYEHRRVEDSALLARRLFCLEQPRLVEALGSSRNGRRLLSRPQLASDVAYCAQRNVFHLLAQMDKAGSINRAG